MENAERVMCPFVYCISIFETIFILLHHIMEEKELISLAQSGDRKALAELVKKYEHTVYNFAYKICRDKEKAEHTMQETFLSVLKSLKTFDNRSKFSTWLYRIALNHCLMMARTGKKHLTTDIETEEFSFEEQVPGGEEFSPEKKLEQAELKEYLDAAIAKLAEEYRIVFTLRDVEQFSTEETAQMTGLSVPAVKSRLHRARAFLRNELIKVYKR